MEKALKSVESDTLECALCENTIANDMEAVLDAGWEPDAWDKDNCIGPVCNVCAAEKIGTDESGERFVTDHSSS